MSRSFFVTLDNPDGRTTKGYFGASFNAAAQGGVCLNLVNGAKRYLPFSAKEFEMLVRDGEDNPTGLRFVDFSRENWPALYERLDELERIKCWQTTPDPDLPEYGLCYDF
jgi:hypothetical protein